MKILVTAGNTLVPIDRVRGITNVFTGRTGAMIALHAHQRGHDVTLVTSHPETVESMLLLSQSLDKRWKLRRYRTFSELQNELTELVTNGGFDAIIHCAAVSDFLLGGVYGCKDKTHFDLDRLTWSQDDGSSPQLEDRSSGKIKSDSPEVWLRLVRAPKLIDMMRSEWGFRGQLVKFKLEVNVDEDELRAIAELSRRHSDADLVVANTLEGAGFWGLIGPLENGYERVNRRMLGERLLEVLEQRNS